MNIHTILYSYIQGKATEEEKREVVLWLRQDEANVREYLALRKLHDLDTWNTGQKAVSSRKKSRWSPRGVMREVLKMAAVLLTGVCITYTLMPEREEETYETQTIYVPSGQRSELFLADGTKVWLNSGTTLTFPERFSRRSREITLDGEAYFQVTRDHERPFLVHTAQHDIRVVGTEFNVIAYEGKPFFETALLEGCVEILADRGEKSFLLKKDETLSLREGTLVRGNIPDHNYFKWREGLICFEKENLSSLFAKLELYYDIRIVNHNAALKKGSYTGKFRIRDGIEHVLKVLQLKHSFTYTRDDDTNTIVIN